MTSGGAVREILREIVHTRQVPGENRRRWFSSTGMDLVAWYDEAGALVGFQLCYDKQHGEHALTWHAGSGLSHRAVDDGEHISTAHPMRHKATPILVPDGVWQPHRVRERFVAESGDLPADLVNRVLAELDRAGAH